MTELFFQACSLRCRGCCDVLLVELINWASRSITGGKIVLRSRTISSTLATSSVTSRNSDSAGFLIVCSFADTREDQVWADRAEALVYHRKAFSPKLSQVLRSGGCVPGAACLATNMPLTKPAFVCGRISSLYHGADHAGVVVLWQHSS